MGVTVLMEFIILGRLVMVVMGLEQLVSKRIVSRWSTITKELCTLLPVSALEVLKALSQDSWMLMVAIAVNNTLSAQY